MSKTKETLFDPHPKQVEFIEACLSGKYSFVLFGGAIRGGKTYAVLGMVILICRMFAGAKYAIIRKDLARIKKNVFPSFNQICPKGFIETQASAHNEWTVTFTNGSQIIFFAENIDKDRELDRFKGLEIDGVVFEEMDITEKGFDKGLERVGTWKMGERMRAKAAGESNPPAIAMGTCNPSKGWVKSRLYDKWKNGKLPKHQKYIPSKVWDNPFIDPEWIESKRSIMTPLNYTMFMEGDWEVDLNEQPFFYEYNRDKHVSADKMMIDPNEFLWFSFDFNMNPTTCIVGQKTASGPKVIRVHQCDGGTRILCQELKIYKNFMIRVTGDNSGTSASSAAGMKGGENVTDYQVIAEELDLIPKQFIDVRTANRRHKYSRDLCNLSLHRLPWQMQEEDCASLIIDLSTGQPTKDGKLLKDRGNHKQDAGDAFRYLNNVWFLGGFDDVRKYERFVIS